MPTHLAAYDEAHSPPWAALRLEIGEYVERGWAWLYVAHDAGRAAGLLGDLPGGNVRDTAGLGFYATPFRVNQILKTFRELIGQAVGGGAAGLLVLVEMGWAVRTPAGAIYHREYEAGVHDLCSELPAAFVCIHPRPLLLGGQLLTSLHLHPEILGPDGHIHPNPHFVPPRVLVRQDERAHFQHWLEGIDPAFHERSPGGAALTLTRPHYTLDAMPPLVVVGAAGGKWKIRTFGGLRVYREDGTPLDFQVPGGATRKLKTLFAFLLFRAEEGATPEELVELLWPELGAQQDDLAAGLNRLYQSVTSLRRVLTQPGGQGRQFLRQDGGRYVLGVPEHTWLDFPMFQELCFQGATLDSANDSAEAILAYQSAERLYTGEFLADVPLEAATNATLEWCWNRRAWYRDMHLKAVTNLARLYRRTGQLTEAHAACDLVLRVEPTYEAAQEEKLLAYAAAARPDAVKRQYRTYALALTRSGLGEPSAALRNLYAELTAQA